MSEREETIMARDDVRKMIARAIRKEIRCDATGLSPAVASVFLCGFEEATDAVLAAIAEAGLAVVPREADDALSMTDSNAPAVPNKFSGAASGKLRDATPLTLTYTNWRGETSVRRIVPLGSPYQGSNEWHLEYQWLLRAWDCDKQAEREFAMLGFAPAIPARVKHGRAS